MTNPLRWATPLALLLALSAALLASRNPASNQPGDEPGRDQPQNNRQLLEQWKLDPAHYQRLQQDLLAFKAMPPEKQTRIRQLDQDLRQMTPASRQRLWTVMERYSAWLKQLPAAQRQHIESATTEEEKLDRIRKQREREWLARLPRKVQEEIRAIEDEQTRAMKIQEVKALERQRRRDWLYDPGVRPATPRKDKPARLSEFPAEVIFFAEHCLHPLLTDQERTELDRAGERPWPALARKLLELSEKHPLVLPGPTGKVRLADLTGAQVEQMVKNPRQFRKIQEAQGKWPEFGQAVLELSPRQRLGVLPPETMPSRPDMLAKPVREFLFDDLMQVLTSEEQAELRQATGSWPAFPQTLVKLAKKHDKQVPLMRLPGQPELWEKARGTGPGT